MLQKSQKFQGIDGPVVVIVMDGVGITEANSGNAVAAAKTPILDMLAKNHPTTSLRAHGVAVGMPSDADMGNSEVGHNAIGSGQVYSQGAALVNDAISSEALYQGEAWKEVAENAKKENHTLHLIGLFSDGNVHSHIDHLKALIVQSKKEGISKVRVHALLDGRDVPATSALEYVEPFEQWCSELCDSDFDVCIASSGGRMNITMDRYEADWSMVERGWKIHVLGEGPAFASCSEGIKKLREENAGILDQDLPGFVIEKDGKVSGTIEDGDSVVFFNFRGDRAIEISRAFEEEQFEYFDRIRFPKTVFAGMLQYDGDLQLPKRFLVAPPAIRNTLGEWLSSSKIAQYACSETQKFGHVTYFWNGNRSGKFDDSLEDWEEVPSDIVPFEQRPWMKSAEVTDKLIAALQSQKYRFLRVNYPNGDMVGHTGNFDAAVIGVESVDLALSRLLPVIDELGGVALITADHGNADEMIDTDKKGNPKLDQNGVPKAKTSHTLNKVPLYLYDGSGQNRFSLKQDEQAGLSNLAATVSEILGFEAHESWDSSLLKMQENA